MASWPHRECECIYSTGNTHGYCGLRRSCFTVVAILCSKFGAQRLQDKIVDQHLPPVCSLHPYRTHQNTCLLADASRPASVASRGLRQHLLLFIRFPLPNAYPGTNDHCRDTVATFITSTSYNGVWACTVIQQPSTVRLYCEDYCSR